MAESEQTMKRYLLGELSEQEQLALEEEYFTDPQVFNQVLKTESELVDAYVRGRLSTEMRERFERSYLAHPARSERVKFAAALTTRLDLIEESVARVEQPTAPLSSWQKLLAALRGQRPMLGLSLALATLLIMLGGIWFFIESRREQQRQLAQTQAAREAQQRQERELSQPPADGGSRKEELTAEQKPAERSSQQTPQPTLTPKSSSAPQVVSLALTAGGVRGSEGGRIPTLVIFPETSQARLRLNLKENAYPSYRASLQTVAGEEIFNLTDIKPARANAGASFVFTVPARKLAGGDYILTLRGVSPDGEIDDLSKSLFRVERR